MFIKLIDNNNSLSTDNSFGNDSHSDTSSYKLTRNGTKKFGVDPLQTSYEVLISLISKDFSLN
jgi:hypothetical protein